MFDLTRGDRSPLRARALLAAVLSAAVVATGPVAFAADQFRFRGSGYGHGIGMSQWGAYGLAQKGWGYRRILTHFYRGTQVQESSTLPSRIRVGLTSGRPRIHLTARRRGVDLLLDGRNGSFVARVPAGETWTVSRAKNEARYAIRDASGRLVGGRRWGGPASPLFATWADGGRVFIPEADDLWGQGFTYAYGFLEFDLVGCASRCAIRLTNDLPFESYLRGIGEMPSSWPAGALRAQAVAARTYATFGIRRSGLRSSCDCHLSDGAGDQVFVGWTKEKGIDGDRWVAAVTATTGEVVTYGGAVIQAFYAASDGGYSEDVEDVWHGGDPDFAIPYLRGVCDPGEYTSANPWTDWTRSFAASTVTMRLSPYTGGIGTIRRFTDARRGESGRIISILVRGSTGSARVSGGELRSALSLPDGRVWINQNRSIVGSIRAEYDGLMCRPGLPRSAAASFDHGSRQLFAIGGIYRNSRVGLILWLKGALHREYLRVGGAGGRLGLPVSRPQRSGTSAPTTCSTCRRLVLEHGRIYSKAGAGTHALWGSVLAAYLNHGGAQGALGYPTTRVRSRDGVRSALFEHGAIACSGGSCDVTVG